MRDGRRSQGPLPRLNGKVILQQRIVVIVRRILPYHADRIVALRDALGQAAEVVALEVTSQESTYRHVATQPVDSRIRAVQVHAGSASSQALRGRSVRAAVLSLLQELAPSHVLAPAPAYAEGMAAIDYKLRVSDSSLAVMDDVWDGCVRLSRLNRYARRRLLGYADAVFVSSELSAWFHYKLGVPPERIVRGVNAVDGHRFRAEGQSSLARHRRFLFVGRIAPEKGVELLLDAYRRYVEASSGNSWELRIVGGPLDRSFLSRVRLAGAEAVGPLEGRALVREYQSAGCLVVPSHREPWGLVVNEALASGLPVVASSAVGSAWSLIRNGANGSIVETGSPSALAEAMRQWADRIDCGIVEAVRPESRLGQSRELAEFVRAVESIMRMPRFKRAPGFIDRVLLNAFNGRGLS